MLIDEEMRPFKRLKGMVDTWLINMVILWLVMVNDGE